MQDVLGQLYSHMGLQVFKYQYGDVVGKYVVLTQIDDLHTLVYTLAAPAPLFPKFKLILNTVHESSPRLDIEEIQREELVDEYMAFRRVMSAHFNRSIDEGQRRLLRACESVFGGSEDDRPTAVW